MELKPSENTRLYGMKYFFDEISKLYNEKKLPTKILLSGKRGIGKSTLAYHVINYILSIAEDSKYDYRKFNDVNYTNTIFVNFRSAYKTILNFC